MGVKLKKAVGVSEFVRKEFDVLKLPEKWHNAFGEISAHFSACIYGLPGNGKTDFCMQFAIMLSEFGNVLYNSVEQGFSKSMQQCILRHNASAVNGKMVFTNDLYDDLILRLDKRKSARFVILDSRDQMGLTYKNFLDLLARYPKKSFIVVCYENGAQPNGNAGKSIWFKSDMKIRVRLFEAEIKGRYVGKDEIFVSWEEGAKREREKIRIYKQLKLTQ